MARRSLAYLIGAPVLALLAAALHVIFGGVLAANAQGFLHGPRCAEGVALVAGRPMDAPLWAAERMPVLGLGLAAFAVAAAFCLWSARRGARWARLTLAGFGLALAAEAALSETVRAAVVRECATVGTGELPGVASAHWAAVGGEAWALTLVTALWLGTAAGLWAGARKG